MQCKVLSQQTIRTWTTDLISITLTLTSFSPGATLLSVPYMHQTHCHLQVFALAVSSTQIHFPLICVILLNKQVLDEMIPPPNGLPSPAYYATSTHPSDILYHIIYGLFSF